MEGPVYYFFHGYLSDVELFSSLRYIHFVKVGPEECLFDPMEAPDCVRDVMQPFHGIEAYN